MHDIAFLRQDGTGLAEQVNEVHVVPRVGEFLQTDDGWWEVVQVRWGVVGRGEESGKFFPGQLNADVIVRPVPDSQVKQIGGAS